MAKAKPISGDKHLRHSVKRTAKLITKNLGVPVGELRHSEDTAVVDILGEQEIYLDYRAFQQTDAAKHSVKSRAAAARDRHQEIIDRAEYLRAGGTKVRALVGIIARERSAAEDRLCSEGQIRTILQKAEILPPKKKRNQRR